MKIINQKADHAIQVEPDVRHNWRTDDSIALFELPFMDLVHWAQELHRRYFPANEVQRSNLLSVKTGGCPEDCSYCPQSAHHQASVEPDKLMDINSVLAEARTAKTGGATRFCMGAAWRNPKDRDMPAMCQMIEGVRSLGLETCATLGMLTPSQAEALKNAGLDYYNHNIDTSEAFYSNIITTRTYEDRLDTLMTVRQAGMKVCAGGIVGMGETRVDRADMLVTLANLKPHPESVPINLLVPVEGTPLADTPDFDPLEFVRTVAIAKIMMPSSVIRLSAGREQMSDEFQTLCFLAGASSVFVGPKLLTTDNPARGDDDALFERLGLNGAKYPGGS
ncbi:MAG: biotin synthase BioB [Rhodospirillaceae bacterium TMED8]|nr:biotin synthase BioB [Magnetovibrio sp.]OUT50776.1 MAG: biotin synthase BioB [Rhodospirillaceae bacterium TMED8]|tara:strand:+ start:85 stop:1089 length:1005 start_codon:yes stop_codon:yes gene_type:complete